MKVGDLVKLVKETTTYTHRPSAMGIILEIDYTHGVGDINCPYLVSFFNGEHHWIRPGFIEAINESR